jgi:hypothetical protein
VRGAVGAASKAGDEVLSFDVVGDGGQAGGIKPPILVPWGGGEKGGKPHVPVFTGEPVFNMGSEKTNNLIGVGNKAAQQGKQQEKTAPKQPTGIPPNIIVGQPQIEIPRETTTTIQKQITIQRTGYPDVPPPPPPTGFDIPIRGGGYPPSYPPMMLGGGLPPMSLGGGGASFRLGPPKGHLTDSLSIYQRSLGKPRMPAMKKAPRVRKRR